LEEYKEEEEEQQEDKEEKEEEPSTRFSEGAGNVRRGR